MSLRQWPLIWLMAIFASACFDHAIAIQEVVGQIDEGDLGQLNGSLADAHGDQVFAGRAVVFLCDAETGLPIHRETKRRIRPTFRDPQFDQLWFAETDDRGDFTFVDVPAGTYRLVAQSWSGTTGFSGFDSNAHPSEFLVLHGTCENVVIQGGQQTSATIRQLGQHTLRVTNDPKEPHALLLIGLKPTLGDGILGPAGWGTEFRRSLIGVTQMEVPFVTIMGLPENLAVHVGLMNYDNNPGFGAASFEPGEHEGTLRIVASWSNGHKDPPPELQPLVDHLEKKGISPASFLEGDAAEQAKGNAFEALFGRLLMDNDCVVNVPEIGETRLADVIAAYAYIQMQKGRKSP